VLATKAVMTVVVQRSTYLQGSEEQWRQRGTTMVTIESQHAEQVCKANETV